MAQFNFGSNLGAGNANTSGYSFGAPNKTVTSTFGSLGNATTQPSGSITFGTPIASIAPTPQTPAFGATAPTLGTSLNFGSPAPPAQPSLNFGATTKAPTLNFGTPTSQPTLNFGGVASSTTSNLSFGAPQTSTAPSGLFGTPASSAQTGGLFGNPISAPTGGLNFGTPAPTTSSTVNPLGGISFTPTSNPIPLGGGLSFGTPTSNATPLGGGGLTFGTPTSNANPLGGGLTFGTPTSTANPLGGGGGGLTFGTPVSSTNPLGGGLNFGTPTSNANPLKGINFGTPTSTTSGFTLGTSTATPGLNFNTGSSSTLGGTSLNFSTGLGGTATSTTPGLNLKSFTPGLSTVTTLPTSTPIGLGGVDSSQLKTGTITTDQSKVAAKENVVPNEILQSIETFKQFVKDQKTFSSDISRGSARPFGKVKEDVVLVNNILTDVGNDLQRNQQQADKLKYDSAKCLHNAEMAQRTYDTPPGLQFENTAPLRYFIDLVNQFEQDLHALRVQIDVTDKHFQSLHEPKFLTSQELAIGMRRLHDTFVALAGRLQSVHTQVESQKEQYLNLRKYILKDPTDIFVKPASKEQQNLDVALRGLSANKTITGPTPFSSFGSPFGLGLNVIANQPQPEKPPPAYPTTGTTLNFGSNTANTGALGASAGILGTTQLGATSSIFGSAPTLGPPNTSLDSSFQLQSPPLGNKRGKR